MTDPLYQEMNEDEQKAERLELMIQRYRDGDIFIGKACMCLNLTEEEFFAEKYKKLWNQSKKGDHSTTLLMVI